uniref:RNA-dependent RNA polymerase n=2 Tax=Mitoviridae TaxID=2732892 RepID=A0A0M4KGZ4_9VIRU|nr:RNA-dependent RNA polymerase [Sclerotinia sclerotiorum mitovirus 7]ALD89137.1 RNA-dependent RNA polymerase [Sclerotinia sclerotiorum mitovirus 20]
MKFIFNIIKKDIIKYLSYINKRPLEVKDWISTKEIHLYFLVVSWIFRSSIHRCHVRRFADKILYLIDKSGSNFAFLYLKECFRLVTRSLAGQQDKCRKIFVRVDKSGLPKIIPGGMRRYIRYGSSHQKEIRFILTLLSVFRLLATSPVVSYDTIELPFSGVRRSFDVRVAASRLWKGKINIASLPMFIIGGESSGPNSKKAAWGSLLDALALLHHPLPCLRYLVQSKSWFWLIWLLNIWLVFGPLYFIISFTTSSRLEEGRLSVVRDQAGKARVVAITNWWLQLCLRPLHRKIFSILKRVPTDGTFNQIAPAQRLVERSLSDKELGRDPVVFHCFDLTAATDRLPVDLQSDILIALGFPGGTWRSLLDISWFVPEYVERIKYSVGQPMGAYSSWGMLAITHHVIVQEAAARSGFVGFFDDYAVLGDDIVIRNDQVSGHYTGLMNDLGLEINPYKSISSSEFMEFAKRLIGPDLDYTPFGPGLVLQSIRNRGIVSSVLREAISLNIINFCDVVSICSSSPRFIKVKAELVLWNFFSKVLREKPNLSNAFAIDMYSMALWNSGEANHYDIIEVSVRIAREQFSDLNPKKDFMFFIRNFYKSSMVRDTRYMVFDTLFSVFSPGFWFYILQFIKTVDRYDTAKYTLEHTLFTEVYSVGGTSAVMQYLSSLDSSRFDALRWDKEANIKSDLISKEYNKEFPKIWESIL